MVHDGEAVAQGLGFLHVVRGVEDAGAGLRLFPHQVEEADAALRIDLEHHLRQQIGEIMIALLALAQVVKH